MKRSVPYTAPSHIKLSPAHDPLTYRFTHLCDKTWHLADILYLFSSQNHPDETRSSSDTKVATVYFIIFLTYKTDRSLFMIILITIISTFFPLVFYLSVKLHCSPHTSLLPGMLFTCGFVFPSVIHQQASTRGYQPITCMLNTSFKPLTTHLVPLLQILQRKDLYVLSLNLTQYLIPVLLSTTTAWTAGLNLLKILKPAED